MTRRRDSGGSAREQPSAGPAPSSLGIAALGVTDSAFTNLARHAVSLVLDSVREVLNDVETFSEALTGAGAFVCGHLDLPASFAPFVEAEAARLVAAVPASRLSALALPAIVASRGTHSRRKARPVSTVEPVVARMSSGTAYITLAAATPSAARSR